MDDTLRERCADLERENAELRKQIADLESQLGWMKKRHSNTLSSLAHLVAKKIPPLQTRVGPPDQAPTLPGKQVRPGEIEGG